MSVHAAASIEARSDRLVALLEQRELDCLLVTNLFNVRYLTGFSGTSGACLVSAEERLFLTDFRYLEQADQQVRGYETVTAERELLAGIAERLRGRTGFEDSHMTVQTHEKLSERLPGSAQLVAAGGLLEGLRAVKDDWEIAAMRAAAEIADTAFADLRERGLVGRSEREVALTAARTMVDRGADDVSFPPIVASGAHGALPHAEPRDVEIPRDTLVVIDMGANVDGYCSDCTRTLATGAVGDAALEVYELVRSAQAAALEATVAGAELAAVDGVARERIAAAGQGERFGHGLGHGVGLEVHERPRLGKTATGALVAGNAVTVEPGVYVAGELGVRIEDLVIVSAGDPDVLTSFPKELVTVA